MDLSFSYLTVRGYVLLCVAFGNYILKISLSFSNCTWPFSNYALFLIDIVSVPYKKGLLPHVCTVHIWTLTIFLVFILVKTLAYIFQWILTKLSRHLFHTKPCSLFWRSQVIMYVLSLVRLWTFDNKHLIL
jgi:hypothetical protein